MCIKNILDPKGFPKRNAQDFAQASLPGLFVPPGGIGFSLHTPIRGIMKPIVVALDFLEFPPTYTCDGGNRSPRITLSDPDDRTVSFAVMVFNPFIKTCCSFTPWIIWNLPPHTIIPDGIPPGEIVTVPVSAVQGTTDYGTTGYTGPCPPPGETHRYQFKVYGLDAMLEIPPGSDKHALVAAMKGHVMQFGETVALCTR